VRLAPFFANLKMPPTIAEVVGDKLIIAGSRDKSNDILASSLDKLDATYLKFMGRVGVAFVDARKGMRADEEIGQH
jgi:hypothetical protein